MSDAAEAEKEEQILECFERLKGVLPSVGLRQRCTFAQFLRRKKRKRNRLAKRKAQNKEQAQQDLPTPAPVGHRIQENVRQQEDDNDDLCLDLDGGTEDVPAASAEFDWLRNLEAVGEDAQGWIEYGSIVYPPAASSMHEDVDDGDGDV